MALCENFVKLMKKLLGGKKLNLYRPLLEPK